MKERRADYLKVLSLFNTPNTPNINRRQKQFALDSLVAYKNEIHNYSLEQFCSELSGALVDVYRNNKETSEDDRNVIRQVLSLISHQTDIKHIRECVKREINAAQLNAASTRSTLIALQTILT